MRKKLFSLLLALILSLIYFSIYYYKTYLLKIDIIYTNDLHGNIDVLPKIAYYVTRIRNKNLLLIDGGDFIQGTPESDFFKGVSMVETFNFMKYDYVQVGNHEFDFGEKNLVMLAQNSRFKFLGSNIVDLKGNIKSYLTEFDIKTFDGINIGIFGLITAKTKDMVLKENLGDTDFLDEIQTAKSVVEKLNNNGAKIVFCISHIGLVPEEKKVIYESRFSDLDLANQVPGINIIFGAHTHQKYTKRAGKTLLVQTGAYGKMFGHLTIWINKRYGNIFWIKNKFVNTKRIKKKHKEIEILVNNYIQEVSKIYDIEVGKLEVSLTRDKNQESSLGNFVADIIADNVKCDFAVTNSGGLRADIYAGTVTYRNIYNTMPFDNTIVYTKLYGKEIKEMFEYSAKNEYGILQVSRNVNLVYDKNRKLSSIKINNVSLEENKLYIVATNNFVSSGGDGYVWFTKHKVVDTKKLLREAIKEYFEQKKSLNIIKEQRIVFEK